MGKILRQLFIAFRFKPKSITADEAGEWNCRVKPGTRNLRGNSVLSPADHFGARQAYQSTTKSVV